MKEEQTKSFEKLGSTCWRVAHVLFFMSIILLFTIPDEWNEGIRIALSSIAYSTGLPLILGHPLIYAEKKGWLTD
ncbi:MAG: hypothetical protein AAF546_09685 [Verrucomicrobiota bacterium]